MFVCWSIDYLAVKNIQLADAKLEELKGKKEQLNRQLTELNEKNDKLKKQERDIALSIENDTIGKQISDLADAIAALEAKKQQCIATLEKYNSIAQLVGLDENNK